MPEEAWTNERVALLKEMWADGSTAAAIAVRLGISRSAVMGKIFRLRLRAAASVSMPKAQTNAGSQGQESAAASRTVPSQPPQRALAHDAPARRRGRAARQRRVKSSEAHRVPARRRGKTLLELTNETCRWPFGRPGTTMFHFCGASGADLENGRPYCADHAQRAYLTRAKPPNLAPANRRKSASASPLSAAATQSIVINTGRRR